MSNGRTESRIVPLGTRFERDSRRQGRGGGEEGNSSFRPLPSAHFHSEVSHAARRPEADGKRRRMDPTFSIFTALAYFPPPAAISLPLLPEHLERLRTAHSELSTKLPDSWCALVHFPNVETIRKVLLDCVELGGQGDAQRVRNGSTGWGGRR